MMRNDKTACWILDSVPGQYNGNRGLALEKNNFYGQDWVAHIINTFLHDLLYHVVFDFRVSWNTIQVNQCYMAI
jgi:hypothetical protein